jgi:hypothetical protein
MKTIRKIVHRKATEWWKRRIGNREVIPQAVWHAVKSLLKQMVFWP